MKDLLIGGIHKLSIEEIRVWYKSARASGFSGDIALIAYSEPQSVIDELGKDGILVVTPTVDHLNRPNTSQIYPKVGQFEINRLRFYDIWAILLQAEYRYVIATDTRDVVFQRNPSEWLENNIGDHKLVVGSECIKYKDSKFNNRDMNLNYGPFVLEYLMKDSPVICCGVIAGTLEGVRNTSLLMYLIATGCPDYAEQASLGILVNSGIPAKVTTLKDGFIAHCAIPFDPQFSDEWQYLMEPIPKWERGTLYDANGNPFYIVHQYNRIGGAVDTYKKRYD